MQRGTVQNVKAVLAGFGQYWAVWDCAESCMQNVGHGQCKATLPNEKYRAALGSVGKFWAVWDCVCRMWGSSAKFWAVSGSVGLCGTVYAECGVVLATLGQYWAALSSIG